MYLKCENIMYVYVKISKHLTLNAIKYILHSMKHFYKINVFTIRGFRKQKKLVYVEKCITRSLLCTFVNDYTCTCKSIIRIN